MMLSRRELFSGSAAAVLPALLSPLYSKGIAQQKGSGNSFSLHIGVNKLSAAQYGNVTQLRGCVNDAEVYRKIAINSGFQKSEPLYDEKATIKNVKTYIYHAASHMKEGDTFFVSYAGHGTQVKDTSGDETDDHKDEAWCLHDGLLLDDYLNHLWARFKPGIRLLVVSDSCHSGTVARTLQAVRALNADLQQETPVTRDLFPNLHKDVESVSKSRGILDAMNRNLIDGLAQSRDPDSDSSTRAAIDQAFAELDVRPRAISPADGQRAFNKKKGEYQMQQEVAARDNQPGDVKAFGILLSGCQDNEVSLEAGGSTPGGIFTARLSQILNQNPVNYPSFLKSIAAQMHSGQNPNLFLFGKESPDFIDSVPFKIS